MLRLEKSLKFDEYLKYYGDMEKENLFIKKLKNINQNKINNLSYTDLKNLDETNPINNYIDKINSWSNCNKNNGVFIFDFGTLFYTKYKLVHYSKKARVYDYYGSSEKKLFLKHFSIYLNDELVNFKDYSFFKEYYLPDGNKFYDYKEARMWAIDFTLNCVKNPKDKVTIYELKGGFVDNKGKETYNTNFFKFYERLNIYLKPVENLRRKPKNKLMNNIVLPNNLYLIKDNRY